MKVIVLRMRIVLCGYFIRGTNNVLAFHVSEKASFAAEHGFRIEKVRRYQEQKRLASNPVA